MTRHSSLRPDYGNMVQSWKGILDALKGVLIVDDSAKFLVDEYTWEQCPPGERGWCTIRIEEVAET